jgi:acetyltransferase-like isoleucine patch superfamily enzyme
VSGDLPPFSVAVGNPARVIRRYVEGEGWIRV